MIADHRRWGTFAWAEFVLGIPGVRVAGGTDEVMRNIVGSGCSACPRSHPARPGVSAAVLPFERLRALAGTPATTPSSSPRRPTASLTSRPTPPSWSRCADAPRRTIPAAGRCGGPARRCWRIRPRRGGAGGDSVLARDRTANEVGVAAPVPHDDAIAILGWPDTTGAALEERPDPRRRVDPCRSPTPARRGAAGAGPRRRRGHRRVAEPSPRGGPGRGGRRARWFPMGSPICAGRLSAAKLWLVVPDRPAAPRPAVRGPPPPARRQRRRRGRSRWAAPTRSRGRGGLDAAGTAWPAQRDCPVAPELLRL